jgi:NAD dependent epimerase/dehydratase family enzyme
MADVLLFSQRVIPAKAEALGFRFRYAALEPARVAALQH